MSDIFWIPAPPGRIGIMAAPGVTGNYAGDLSDLIAARPVLVLSMTEPNELDMIGAAGFGTDLARAEIARRVLPIRDFSGPKPAQTDDWAAIAAMAHDLLDAGKDIVIHCRGGCGRSGMATLRLLVERGENPDAALKRMRKTRPCAVETDAQFGWAAEGVKG